MESDIFDRALRAFCRRIPFQSFTVELSSGDRITVDHPEALVYRHGVAAYIATDGALTILDYKGVTQMIGAPENQSTSA